MRSGFTLVELSIALVIIGLLIGGILVSQSMIETARVQRTFSNLQQYEIAFDNFYTSYKQLPGDSTFFRFPGNNNGAITEAGGNCAQESERYNVFGHLSEAEMLKGNYVGICDAPDPSVYDAPANAGVVYPLVTDAKVNHDGALLGSTSLIIVSKTSSANTIQMFFSVPAEQVTPLEAKMPFAASMSTGRAQGGLYNAAGPGNCVDGGYTPMSCTTNPAGTWGYLYYFAPIK